MANERRTRWLASADRKPEFAARSTLKGYNSSQAGGGGDSVEFNLEIIRHRLRIGSANVGGRHGTFPAVLFALARTWNSNLMACIAFTTAKVCARLLSSRPLLFFSLLAAVSTPGASQTEDHVTTAEYRQAASTGGDWRLGQQVFESPTAKCAACHLTTIGERRAGPPLSSVGDKLSREQLIASVLEPSAMIHPDYDRIAIQTKDGTVLAGVLSKRTEGNVELFDGEGKLRVVSLEDVEQERKGGASLMPEHLHTAMSTVQFQNLIAYLESLKQVVPAGQQPPGLVDHIPVVQRSIQLKPLHTEQCRFDHPVGVLAIPGSPHEFVVVEQKTRRVWRFATEAGGDRKESKELFVDVSPESITGEFDGLVCMAFHPNYLENGKYYLKYHVRENGVYSPVIVERLATADRRHDSGALSRRLLRIQQTTDLHWGGMLAFGPDGYLYIGAGDGGPQEDPDGNGQNLLRWQGSILRIDVDRATDARPYAIPHDNPFTDRSDALPEIWAYGFRMPWRFSFDSLTGDLWVGDVGQNLFEEITIARRGENHGWNVYEGFTPFSNRYRREDASYTSPVVAYRRKNGVSVTGGFVYRGSRNEAYSGVYLCGDFESRRIWGVSQVDRQLVSMRQIGESPERIVSFGRDADGELLLVGYEGTIYRLVLDQATFE